MFARWWIACETPRTLASFDFRRIAAKKTKKLEKKRSVDDLEEGGEYQVLKVGCEDGFWRGGLSFPPSRIFSSKNLAAAQLINSTWTEHCAVACACCVLLHVRFGSVDVNGTTGRAASRLTAAAAARIGGRIVLDDDGDTYDKNEQQQLGASLGGGEEWNEASSTPESSGFITKRGQPLYH